MQNTKIRIKLQILCGAEAAIGPGKADLMAAIEKEGSISGAGRALGMSYRRAWLLVDTLNHCWTDRLVETTSGGSSSRGARLTVKGRVVLDNYRALQRQLEAATAGEALDALIDGLRDEMTIVSD